MGWLTGFTVVTAVAVAGLSAFVSQMDANARYNLLISAVKPLIGELGMGEDSQLIDDHYYLSPKVNPLDRIEAARKMVWGGDDLVVATFPKSGTHMLVLTSILVLLKGEWVEETDLHSLIYSPEFRKGEGTRDLDEPREHFPTTRA